MFSAHNSNILRTIKKKVVRIFIFLINFIKLRKVTIYNALVKCAGGIKKFTADF